MNNKKIGKNFAHIAWEEAFFWEGCPLCFLINKNLWKMEDNFLYELVNDPQIRERIRKGNGFCQEHALQLLNFKDTLGISIIFEDLIKNIVIPSLLKKNLPEETNCFLCEKEEDLLNLYLSTLPNVLMDEKSFILWKEVAYSFCLPHLEIIKKKLPENIVKLIESQEKRKKYPEYYYGSPLWDRDHSMLFLKKIIRKEK
ncbi:MAG: DUF6062 family protein [Dictyoglomaceae bacterium]|nr:DUF6062 family protein [Dictyoglomaceae bacterium]